MDAPRAGRVSILIEACVDAIDAAREAERGGADRLELCGELLQGGVTPSAGLIGAVWERVEIPVFVLVRPRTGDFLYDADEVDVMVRDIVAARAMDVDGVVIGALTRDGDVDIGTVHALMEAAGRMKVTFHRAFDFARDREVALEALIELGVNRVLTSGGAASALKGAASLASLVRQANGRIEILAGGGINAGNVAAVVRESGVGEVHVRAAARVASEMVHRRAGVTLARGGAPGDYERVVANAGEVARIRQAITGSAIG
jgi:copper homeostasis protein